MKILVDIAVFAIGMTLAVQIFADVRAGDPVPHSDSLESSTEAQASIGTRQIAHAIDTFTREQEKHLQRDDFVQSLEQIRYLLAELAGEEEHLSALLAIGLNQAREGRAGDEIGGDLDDSVKECWETFGRLKRKLSPITSMPDVSSDLIGGLHSFMADSMLFARDAEGRNVFAVRGSDSRLSGAIELADKIGHESRQITQLARLFESQIAKIKTDK